MAIIGTDTSFIKDYFDNKEGDALRKTITPNWDTTVEHIATLDAPESATKILEIGCGIGRLLKELHDARDGRHCVGFDASEAMINEGNTYVEDRNIDLIHCQGSGVDIEYADNYFDFAFSFVVFQHIPSTATVHKYINRMHSLLRDGGEMRFQVLAQDFNKGFLWSYHPIEGLEELLHNLPLVDVRVEIKDRWAILSGTKPQ